MLMQEKKVLLRVVVLMAVIASLILTIVASGHVQQGHAQSPDGLTVTDFYTPAGFNPWGTAFDSSGRVWLALPGCDPSPTCSSSTPPGKLAVFNPQANSWVATYQLPAKFGQPLFLAFDQQGKLWFPMPMSNALGMFNPATSTFSQWPVPTAGSGPWAVAVDSKGNIWFTEHYGNKIGRFNPTTHVFKEVTTPAANSVPYGITVDANDNVWFTENNSAVALIGEYTAQGVLQEYKIRNTQAGGLTPHLITIDHSGNVWWSEGWVGMIGRLHVSAATPGTNDGVTEYAYPHLCGTCATHTSGISIDSKGLIWFDDSLQSTFGSFPSSGNGVFSLHMTPTTNSHPHDGLNVDAKDTVWFDEEFANKLARAVQSVATVTPTVSVTPGTIIAQDNFHRANQKFWGKASDGHTWSGDANVSAAFSIAANVGRVAQGGASYNALLGPVASDADVLLTGSMSAFNNTNFGAVLRWTDNNNWYKAYIDGQSLVIQKKVAGTAGVLNRVAFVAKAGSVYNLRFRIVGSSLYAKVWLAGSGEPANWMVTATDSSLVSGHCGLRMLVQGSVALSVTNFIAKAL